MLFHISLLQLAGVRRPHHYALDRRLQHSGYLILCWAVDVQVRSIALSECVLWVPVAIFAVGQDIVQGGVLLELAVLIFDCF